MPECIFCEIIEGKEPAYIVYSDEKVVSFLDKFPIAPGHVLVVPRLHYENFLELTDEVINNLCLVLKKIAIAVKKSLKTDGMRILTNIGASAGQVIFHSHFHIVPTGFYEDNIIKNFVPRRVQSKEYYESIQRAIIEGLKNL